MNGLISIVNGELTLAYDDLAGAVEDLTGKSLRDFNGSGKHFNEWCRLKNYKTRGSQKRQQQQYSIWALEYRDAGDGEVLQPPDQDFWHLWMQHTSFRGFGGSKKLRFTDIHQRIKAATGKPRKGLVETHQFSKESIDRLDVDEFRKASLHRQYLRGFKQCYELAWTDEVFDAIYQLLGDYKDQSIRVTY
jgi:hypothetical protein